MTSGGFYVYAISVVIVILRLDISHSVLSSAVFCVLLALVLIHYAISILVFLLFE